jgi:hypothetical protein
MWPTDEYMCPVKIKPNNPYIRRFLTQINEYNLIFVSFKTDKYNLNIFIGTDKFKKRWINDVFV